MILLHTSLLSWHVPSGAAPLPADQLRQTSTATPSPSTETSALPDSPDPAPETSPQTSPSESSPPEPPSPTDGSNTSSPDGADEASAESTRELEGGTPPEQVTPETAPADQATPVPRLAQEEPAQQVNPAASIDTKALAQVSKARGQPKDEPDPFAPPDRHVEMPARMVARPLSLPEGTLLFGLSLETVFLDHAATSAQAPLFAWGVTEDVQLGVNAGMRYDEELDNWTALDPTPSLLLTFLDRAEVEMGMRAAVVLPLSSKSKTHLRLGAPLLLHPHDDFRVDIEPKVELGFVGPTQVSVELGLSATWQARDHFYCGVGTTPRIGVSRSRKSGADASIHLGTSMGSRGRARADLEAQIFYKNLGGGPEGHYSQGGGLIVQLRFFPELY